jgi:hypothetical protein
MCLAVYLSSDKCLPDIPWNEKSPAFYLEPVAKSLGVRKQFLYEYVYYAGTHEGCGCGFSKDGVVGEELEQSQQNYIALAQVSRNAVSAGAKLQIFTCWEGEQKRKPKTVATVPSLLLQSQDFELQQLQLLNVNDSVDHA